MNWIMDIIIPAQCSIKAHSNSGHIYSRVCTVFSSLIIKWFVYFSLISACETKNMLSSIRPWSFIKGWNDLQKVWSTLNILRKTWRVKWVILKMMLILPLGGSADLILNQQIHCWLTVLWVNLDGRATGHADIKEGWRWFRVFLYSLIEKWIYQE